MLGLTTAEGGEEVGVGGAGNSDRERVELLGEESPRERKKWLPCEYEGFYRLPLNDTGSSLDAHPHNSTHSLAALGAFSIRRRTPSSRHRDRVPSDNPWSDGEEDLVHGDTDREGRSALVSPLTPARPTSINTLPPRSAQDLSDEARDGLLAGVIAEGATRSDDVTGPGTTTEVGGKGKGSFLSRLSVAVAFRGRTYSAVSSNRAVAGMSAGSTAPDGSGGGSSDDTPPSGELGIDATPPRSPTDEEFFFHIPGPPALSPVPRRSRPRRARPKPKAATTAFSGKPHAFTRI